jgi:hypothetical protein
LGGLGADRMHRHDVLDLSERAWIAVDGTPLAAGTAR